MNRLIVITTPYIYPDEAALIGILFANGMERLHLRKPGCGKNELSAILDQIPAEYHDRIVLHDHFELALERPLGGIHLNGRNPDPPAGFIGSISRSCHSLGELERFKSNCDYLFLSPVFNSISKEGYGAGFMLDQLRNANGLIDHKVIALGGICEETIGKLGDIPFGGYAILGALWGESPSLSMADKIVERFKRLRLWV